MVKFLESCVDDEYGVSPVVGVILMVAITVILAAVIGTFVLDLGGSVQADASAGVTFSEENNVVTVQLVSVQRADYIYVISDPGSKLIGGIRQGGYAMRGPHGLMYLLNDTAGGPGSTVIAQPGNGYVDGGTLTVIGVYDGRETVLQRYEMRS